MNAYRQRIWDGVSLRLHNLGRQEKVLDFGCGDGWFASKMIGTGLCRELIPLDVKLRERRLVEPKIYDGGILPFADKEFSLSYAIDVLHHCPDPHLQLRELARVTSKYILIKDHTYHSLLGKAALAVLDEVGNRKFGIPSLYLYQKDWSWRPILEAEGWREIYLGHPVRCHAGIMGMLTNGLQYLSVFQRV